MYLVIYHLLSSEIKTKKYLKAFQLVMKWCNTLVIKMASGICIFRLQKGIYDRYLDYFQRNGCAHYFNQTIDRIAINLHLHLFFYKDVF